MRRPVVFLAGLIAAFALSTSIANATITYTYMATLQDVTSNSTNLGDSAASYAPGGGVAMAIYLVETFNPALSESSFISAQNGVFSSAFQLQRTNTGDSGATLNKNNIEFWTGATDPAHPGYLGYTGNNTNTNPFAGVNNITGGITGGTVGPSNTGLASGIGEGGAGVTTTSNGLATLYGQAANNQYLPGNGFPDTGNVPNDDENYVGPNSVNNTSNGRNGSGNTTISGTHARRVQFIGSVLFSGGAAGSTTTFKIVDGGLSDPLTFAGRFSLSGNGVQGTTVSTTGAVAPVSWIGTQNYTGFEITVTVTPEPSSMLLGSIAVGGMAVGAYRRRKAKKAAAVVA